MASFRSRVLDRVLRIMTARQIDPETHPAIIREKVNKLARKFSRMPSAIEIETVEIDGMPAEWLRPKNRPDEHDTAATLLYLHGGGYILCGPDTHRGMVATLAKNTGMNALVIDYRLAPEHPFPAAIEDALKAYRWLIANGTPSDKITLAGDSAGGGLTLALLMALREAGDPLPAAAALLSPWTDLAMSGWSHITHRKLDPMLSVEGALLGARHYLGNASPTTPLASPLYGKFENLPPLLIHVGSNEILLDDSLRLAERARAAGVSVEIKVWQGLPHVFQAAQFVPEARLALTEIGDFLRLNLPEMHGRIQAAD